MLATELNTSPNEVMNISNELAGAKDGTLLREEALEQLRHGFMDELSGRGWVQGICVRQSGEGSRRL
jgi:hypothetical protein